MTIAASNIFTEVTQNGYNVSWLATLSNTYAAGGQTVDLQTLGIVPAGCTALPVSGTFLCSSGYKAAWNVGTTQANGKVKIFGVQPLVSTTSAATAGTSEEIIATFTMPAATLAIDGQWILMKASGITAANGNSKVLNLRFGGIGGTIVSTVTTSTSGASWFLDAKVFRTGATTQATQGFGIAGTATTVTCTTAAQTLANAITFVVTGTTASAAGDATFKSYSVEYSHPVELIAGTYPTDLSGDTNIYATHVFKKNV